jgi:hypothetical protein
MIFSKRTLKTRTLQTFLHTTVAVVLSALFLTSCAGPGNHVDNISHAGHNSVMLSPSLLTYGTVPPQVPIVPPQVPIPKIPMQKVIHAIKELSAGRGFIVHIYTTWAEYPSVLPALNTEIKQYALAGFTVSLTLRYMPPLGHNGDIQGFVNYVQNMVADLAHQPAVKFLQITNEPNSSVNPAASDGAYQNVLSALVLGIEAAHVEQIKVGSHAALGFNWFYSFGVQSDKAWWKSLGQLGGLNFVKDVDWIGVDLYPGTYVPLTFPSPKSPKFVDVAKADVANALGYVRTKLMPLAGFGANVPMGISEIGWATSPPTRSFATQARLVTAFSQSACSVAQKDNLVFLQWFNLADNFTPLVQSPLKMGIMKADLCPKPAFYAYQSVVRHGCPIS